MTRIMSCAVCGNSGPPDSKERLKQLARLRDQFGGSTHEWGEGQWAIVALRGVVPGQHPEALVCSVTCAIKETIRQAERLSVRDVRR